jgi:hypothetical protein
MKASWQEDYFKTLIRLRLLLRVNPKQAPKNAIGAIFWLDENLAVLCGRTRTVAFMTIECCHAIPALLDDIAPPARRSTTAPVFFLAIICRDL